MEEPKLKECSNRLDRLISRESELEVFLSSTIELEEEIIEE